ncbi:bifunctional AP complex [Babesia duncani]|uniref:Coatomer subunit zeta n=1 Tax=Babesia duncani TaxID=323732 RepID=A0AAD9PJL2_9APIC|nr:bifunctional AP complex [Babesia duncani]
MLEYIFCKMSLPSITQIVAILILEDSGRRLAVKYYKQYDSIDEHVFDYFSTPEKQKHFEANLTKTSKVPNKTCCLLIDSFPVAYFLGEDFGIFVVGNLQENEILLGDYCETVRKVLMGLVGNEITRDLLYEKIDSIFLLLDDIVDGGIVLERDPNVILKRLACKSGDTLDLPLNQAIYKVGSRYRLEIIGKGLLCHLRSSSEMQLKETRMKLFCLFRAGFATKRVTQKRRYMLKVIHPVEIPTRKIWQNGKFVNSDQLPKSLLCNRVIRKLVYANTVQAQELSSEINWEAFQCDVRGVRWHPSGSWMAQFVKRNYEHNFYVNCRCYFRVNKFGFDEAKRLAITYRKRLELEYEQLEQVWMDLDKSAITRVDESFPQDDQNQYLISTNSPNA